MSWVDALKEYNERHSKEKASQASAATASPSDDDLFAESYAKLKGQSGNSTYSLIPKFYTKVSVI